MKAKIMLVNECDAIISEKEIEVKDDNTDITPLVIEAIKGTILYVGDSIVIKREEE